jgi:Ser-tRNA(Ala) deacylase AlaX
MSATSTEHRTRLVFQHDAHQHTLDACVVAVCKASALSEPDRALFKAADGDQDHVVVTDATVFHPQGGGQPSDVGHMVSGSTRFTVQTVRVNAQGEVLHLGRFVATGTAEAADAAAEAAAATATATVFAPGDAVSQTIDSELRLMYSRYHTAGHVLGAAVRLLLEKEVEGFDELKASHFPDSAACEFRGLIEGKWKDPIQTVVDDYVQRDMPVEIDWWDEDDFRKNGAARLIPDRKAMGMADDEKFRVVRIFGAEVYPCGGTHVDSTRLCGKTNVKKIGRSKGVSRVSYILP